MQQHRRKPMASGNTMYLMVFATVVVVVFWSMFGGSSDGGKVNIKVIVTEDAPTQHSAPDAGPQWLDNGGDLGDEGLVAQLLAQPAGDSPTLGLVIPKAYKGFASEMVETILRRWSIRTQRSQSKVHHFNGADEPTVIVVPYCDMDNGHVKSIICGGKECDHTATAEGLKGSRNVVLIPEGDLLGGLVLLHQMHGFVPGDLLFWAKPLKHAQFEPECGTPGVLHSIATEVLKTKWSTGLAKKREVLRRAVYALPNYCQGLPPSSQCELLKVPHKSIDVRPTITDTQSYVCPSPPSPPAPIPDTQSATSLLTNAQWPQCTKYQNGCAPKMGIVFIKTHKTASSTLEGILQRICVSRRQRCFTHSGKFVNPGYPEQEHEIQLPYPSVPALSSPYSMFVAHTMNTQSLRETHVPTSGGHVLSIVRSTASRYESHWNFWVGANDFVVADSPHYNWKAKDLKPFCEEAARNKTLYNLAATEPLNIRLALNNIARQMLGCTDCGTPEEMQRKTEALVAEIKAPDSKHHVLLTERLSESLVMFKHDYGLETADIMFASRNRGSYKKKRDESLTTCLVELNKYDEMVYAAAVEVHTARVALLGESFKEEVAQFDKLQETVKESCDRCGSNDALCSQCKTLYGKEDVGRVLVDHFRKCKKP